MTSYNKKVIKRKKINERIGGNEMREKTLMLDPSIPSASWGEFRMSKRLYLAGMECREY